MVPHLAERLTRRTTGEEVKPLISGRLKHGCVVGNGRKVALDHGGRGEVQTVRCAAVRVVVRRGDDVEAGIVQALA